MASVTNTYARAFADVVFDNRLDANQTLGEAQSLAALVASSKELREVWESPAIPAGQKRGVLDAIVARAGISRPVRNFVAVLIDHGRIPFIGSIVKQFEQDMLSRLGFAEAEITSARELRSDERKALESEVEKLIGKKVRGRYAQDPAVLGGAIVRVGSTIYDGSVKGQLERIKEAMSS
jgi:F-type H+-transporting ATPase subunit delta